MSRIGYTNLVHVNDFEVAATMQVGFFIALIGGMLTGLFARNMVPAAQTLVWHNDMKGPHLQFVLATSCSRSGRFRPSAAAAIDVA
jgi:hypothetical protein